MDPSGAEDLVVSAGRIDAFLSLPIWLITVIVFLIWGAIAVFAHRVVVPWIAGRDGTKLGGFEAEVVALIGLAFGLLISFNAVTVWETADQARDAIINEVAALEDAAYEIDLLPPAQQAKARAALQAYIDHVLNIEWPLLAFGHAQTERPPALLGLLAAGRESGDGDLDDALEAATDGRMERIRLSQHRMTRARWAVVVLLGILLVVAMGLLHAKHRHGRAVALSFVALAIAVCFIILFAHGRPFVGENALQPTEMRELGRRVAAS